VVTALSVDFLFMDEEVVERGPIYPCSVCTCPVTTVGLANGYQMIVHGEEIAAYIDVSIHNEWRRGINEGLYLPEKVGCPITDWTYAYHGMATVHAKWGGKCRCEGGTHPLYLRG
jgi:hypothetical protein